MTPSQDIWDVVVIGGGAAGLMAAISAREEGARVLLLEKNSVPGKKLLLTGHGRCNLTNIRIPGNYLEAYHENARFLSSAIRKFAPEDVRTFFQDLGVKTHEEDDGRIFPDSGKAETVLQALLQKYADMGGKRNDSHPVGNLCYREENGLWDVRISVEDHEGKPILYHARSVILATGGKSYLPREDGKKAGDAYRIAEELGHSIVPLRPALAPILLSAMSATRHTEAEGRNDGKTGAEATREDVERTLAGVTLPDVGTTLLLDGKKTASARGDLLFTHQGISGPAAMQLSRYLPPEEGKYAPGHVTICIDLLPDQKTDEIGKALLSAMSNRPNMSIRNILFHEFLHLQKAALLVWKEEDRPANAVTKTERNHIAERLKALPLQVEKCTPLSMAYVTRGGVELKGVDPKTMESKIRPGLFFAGEILDIDGISGGYNLQNAWSTGYVAGKSAAKRSVGEGAEDDSAENDKRAE